MRSPAFSRKQCLSVHLFKILRGLGLGARPLARSNYLRNITQCNFLFPRQNLEANVEPEMTVLYYLINLI